MEKMKLKIIVGSTRKNRFSEKPARWIYGLARKRKDIDAEVLDLRDYSLPFFEEAISPMRMGGNYPNPDVAKWAKRISEGDGFIVVTPEYNHGYPAILKNAFDSIYPEWNNKPIGFISYGAAGGARSVEQLRQVAVELQMAPIRSSVNMPFQTILNVMQGDDSAMDAFRDQANAFLDQLAWWANALKTARAQEKEELAEIKV